jgi:hypothetical protein
MPNAAFVSIRRRFSRALIGVVTLVLLIFAAAGSVASRKFVALVSSLKAIWPGGLPERTCSLRVYKTDGIEDLQRLSRR